MPIVSLKEMLKDAREKQYAVGMFDVHNLEMTKAALVAAEQERSPIILAAAEVHVPSKEALEDIAAIMECSAKRSKIPVALHFDHGSSESSIVWAMHKGFSSVMYDGSLLPFEENIRNTKRIVRLAEVFGVSVEAELGHVGGSEGEASVEEEILYTNPDMASEFAERTGADALAVSIGTVHGHYRKEPNLKFSLLEEIKNKVSAPLVLHGGSGLSDEDFRKCIKGGISKINLYTEIVEEARSVLNKRPQEWGYVKTMEEMSRAMSNRIAERLRLFGSSGKA